MALMRTGLDVFIHLDAHLSQWAALLGPWLYGVLFLIIFGETGLVVTPYLPGDSLLFAVGALAAREGSPVSLPWVWTLLSAAAVLGNMVNYAVGKWVGPKIFSRDGSWLLNRKNLDKAHRFYDKYGGKTIILARFIPIIRTFAPFVAGVGAMTYPRFLMFNVVGGFTWVTLITFSGYFFGNIPVIRNNFSFVVLGIIFLSILPAIIEYLKHRRASRA